MYHKCLYAAAIITLCIAQGCNNGRQQAPAAVQRTFVVPSIPQFYTDPQARADYLATHYWDNFDFADTAFYGSSASVTEQATVNFLDVLNYAVGREADNGVKVLMDKALSDTMAYRWFAATLERYLYDPNSPIRNAEYFIPVVAHRLANEHLDEGQRLRLQIMYDNLMKNRPETRAADIHFEMPNGQRKTLSELRSDFVLLIFHNVGCEACRTLIARIEQSEAIKAMQARKQLTILAIYPEAKKDEWQSHLSEIPSSWLCGYDYSGEIDTRETYALSAIPTIFLLDRDKYVILRDPSVAMVEHALTVIAEQL
ncbi:MAG: DUF5106 domain-containing protein [Tannerella sp.]|jgi:hypothetical protein|nr:DUF5106 domain-containing protein [Tannerella sp.]